MSKWIQKILCGHRIVKWCLQHGSIPFVLYLWIKVNSKSNTNYAVTVTNSWPLDGCFFSFSEGSAEGVRDVTSLPYSCQNFLFLVHSMLSIQSEEELGKGRKETELITKKQKTKHITVYHLNDLKWEGTYPLPLESVYQKSWSCSWKRTETQNQKYIF